MRKLLPVSILLLFLTACNSPNLTEEPADTLAQDSLNSMDALADELHSVVDRESWIRAWPKIRQLGRKMQIIRETGDGTLRMTAEVRHQMEDKYKEQMVETSHRLKREFERIVTKVDRGKDYIRDLERLMKQILNEVKDRSSH